MHTNNLSHILSLVHQYERITEAMLLLSKNERIDHLKQFFDQRERVLLELKQFASHRRSPNTPVNARLSFAPDAEILIESAFKRIQSSDTLLKQTLSSQKHNLGKQLTKFSDTRKILRQQSLRPHPPPRFLNCCI